MGLTTNGVVITESIKFVQTNKEKLTIATKKPDNVSKESKEPDYGEDHGQVKEEQVKETNEQETTNQGFLDYVCSSIFRSSTMNELHGNLIISEPLGFV
jgi:hypothetical protein